MNILDELVAKGVAGDVIVAVAKLIAEAELLQRQRDANKERMRAVRARVDTDVHTDARASSLPSTTINNLTVVQEERSEIVALGREWSEFYSRYPHKVAPRKAKVAFERARKRAGFDVIMAGLERYASKTDDRPWANPATWLQWRPMG